MSISAFQCRQPGRIQLKVLSIPGYMHPGRMPGRLVVLDAPEKKMNFISTLIEHSDPDPEKWYSMMIVHSDSCRPEDLQGVFIIMDE